MKKILLVCGSLKPGGTVKGTSATRELLRVVQKGISDEGIPTEFFDLREEPLPFYDGRQWHEYDSMALNKFVAELGESDRVIWAAAAYWRIVSSTNVNLINLVGGPLYDLPEPRTPFYQKRVDVIVVGASYDDAIDATAGFRHSLRALGADVGQPDTIIGNLREMSSEERRALVRSLYIFGRTEARNCVGVTS